MDGHGDDSDPVHTDDDGDLVDLDSDNDLEDKDTDNDMAEQFFPMMVFICCSVRSFTM